MKILACLLLAALTSFHCSAGENTWTVFYAHGMDVVRAQRTVQRVLPEGTQLILRELPARAVNREDMLAQSEAIAAGVHSLPCLVLSDERGVYAAVPLNKLSPETLLAAQKFASAPNRDAQARQRRGISKMIFHTSIARCASAPMGQRLSSLAYLEELTKSSDLSIRQRQFVALHCLYPALMQLYTNSYRGAHTPDTEQLFMRAISSVEFARDLDPDSKFGRLAHNERERLRAARLKAKRLD